jgi:hypothetical protein
MMMVLCNATSDAKQKSFFLGACLLSSEEKLLFSKLMDKFDASKNITVI